MFLHNKKGAGQGGRGGGGGERGWGKGRGRRREAEGEDILTVTWILLISYEHITRRREHRG